MRKAQEVGASMDLDFRKETRAVAMNVGSFSTDMVNCCHRTGGIYMKAKGRFPFKTL